MEIADCTDYTFSHTGGFIDTVQNLNTFKQIAGAFGRVSCDDDGDGFAYYLQLMHPTSGAVKATQADEDGYYALQYKHKGKPTTYTVEVYSDASYGTWVASTPVELQGNGWAEVNFLADSCDNPSTWESSVTYGSGRNKGK